eukprot:ANDGO_06006.mRNA.1 Actin-interacting protein 1
MPVTLSHTHCANPQPIRGSPLHIAVRPIANGPSDVAVVSYGSHKNVFLRPLAIPSSTPSTHKRPANVQKWNDPTALTVYSDHTAQVSSVRVSPSGSYVASGDVSGRLRVWALDNEDRTIKLDIRPLAGRVFDVAWSMDNQRIAVVGEGGRGPSDRSAHVLLWDSGSSVGELSGHSKPVLSVDIRQVRPFRVATGSEDTFVNWFEGPPFKFVHSVRKFSKYVNCVRFSQDGSCAAAVSSDGHVLLLDGKTGFPIERQLVAPVGHPANAHHGGSVFGCAWHPSGKLLATCSADKTIRIWNTGFLSATASASGSAAEVQGVNGNEHDCVATVQMGSTIDDMLMGTVWLSSEVLGVVNLAGDICAVHFDISTVAGTPATAQVKGTPYRFQGHNSPITALSLYPTSEGTYILSAGSDSTVCLWTLGGQCISRAPRSKDAHTNAVVSFGVSGSSVVTAGMDDTIRLLDVDFTAESPCSFKAGASVSVTGTPVGLARSAQSPNICVVATSSSVVIVDGQTVVETIPAPFDPSCVAVTADDSYVVVGSKKDNGVRVYAVDAASGSWKLSVVGTFAGHRGPVTSVAVAPVRQEDGSFLVASGDGNREVCLWNVQSLQRAAEGWVHHTARVNNVAFSPDGKFVASGSLDRSFIIWGVESKTKICVVEKCHIDGVSGLMWASNSKIVTAGQDACIREWDVSV